MSFKNRATAASNLGVQRKLEVFPLEPGTKRPHKKLCPNGCKDSSTDPLDIARWDQRCSEAGVGVRATYDSIGIFEIDHPDYLPPQGLFKPTVETGSREKAWGGKGKPHHYFLQNDYTRRLLENKAITYTNEKGEKKEAASLRVDNEYVVGPESLHPDTGEPYKLVNATLQELTTDQLSWIVKTFGEKAQGADVGTSTSAEPRTRKFHKDFTPDKLFEYYNWKFIKSGPYRYDTHLPGQGCIVADREHHVDGSKKLRDPAQCTFTFIPGQLPTFSCLSGGCSGETFRDAISGFIRKFPKLKPYKIWEKDEEIQEVIFERGDSVDRVATSWLWKPYLAMRKLTHAGGESAMGKSPAFLDIAARVTHGANWPDGTKNELGPRSVIMLASEDDWNDTIMPRFDLAGGDDKKFYLVRTLRMTKGEKTADRMLRLDTDMKALREKAEQVDDLALLVIDPISNYLGDAKMNAEAEVRKILTPLADFAQQSNIAAVTIGHVNRREAGTNALFRFMGAAAFTGVSREVLTIGSDPELTEPYCRIMVPTRSKQDALRFKTYTATKKIKNEDGELVDCEVIGVKWGEKTTADAQDVLEPKSQREKCHEQEAADCLREILKGGKLPAKTCQNEMVNAGFDLNKMDPARVRRRAGVISTNKGRNSEWCIGTKQTEPSEVQQEIGDTAFNTEDYVQEKP